MCIYQAVTLVYSWSQICKNYVSTMILNKDTRAWVTNSNKNLKRFRWILIIFN